MVRPYCQALIVAFPAGDPGLAHVDDYGADAILLDSHAPSSGQVFDWSLAEGAPLNRRLILAGGLTAENVGAGYAEVRPWGVDVASGVKVTATPAARIPSRCRRSSMRHVLPHPSTWSTAATARSTGPSRASEPSHQAEPVSATGGASGTLHVVTDSTLDATMGTPGPDGRFGEFGGTFVPETLVPALQELDAASPGVGGSRLPRRAG